MDGAHAENARQDDLVQAGSKSAGAFANHAADAGKSTQAKAGPLIFDAEMMIQGAAGMTIDLSRFEQGNLPLPGKYRFDLLMNGQWRGIEEIEFRTTADDADAVPCFERSLLVRIGIDLDKSARGQDNEGSNPMPEGLVCEPLKRYVPGAEVKVDVAEQKIFISVPKYFLRAGSSKTYVDPANWDSGITAGLINYNANLFSSQNEERSYTNGYAGLRMGVNVGGVRLRHNGTATWSPGAGAEYQRGNTYLQTDVPTLTSQLLVGESSTSGEFFDPISFRGAQLSSDGRMLPDAYRYYSPVVRGTANSNAKVSIHQRGYLIYETTVAPGAFAIDDLQAASYGGDLHVRVTESNGQEHTFTVPFATTVRLLRPGTTRYSLTAGQVDGPGVRHGQYVLQGVLQHGLGNDITAYGGVSLTGDYLSGLVGTAINTVVGGFAADATVARTRMPQGDTRQGSSYRLSYSKNLPEQGTNFSLLAYRYSTRGYLGLRDAVSIRDRAGQGGLAESFSRLRSRLDANFSQQLGRNGGNLYLTGSSLQYWNRSGGTLSFSLGYGNRWRDISYSVNAQRVHTQYGDSWGGSGNAGRSTVISVSLSIPLGRETRGAPVLSMFSTREEHAGMQLTTGVSGAFGARNSGMYSASLSRDGESRIITKSASLNYLLPRAAVGGSVSQGPGFRQGSFSASGGMVVHEGGVTLGQTLGETVGVIHVPNAPGAQVGYASASVDGRGYALVTSLSPYQLNNIDIDPVGMPEDVELQFSSRSVAPRAGAVVWLEYPTRKAQPILIDSGMSNGDPLPFASAVIDVKTGATIGAVGQGSRLLIRTEEEKGVIRVEWGGKPSQQCLIDYSLPSGPEHARKSFLVLKRPCRPLTPSAAAPNLPLGQTGW